MILCPHADDGAITAACLLHEYAVRRGLPVIEVLVFAGERNVAAPWLNNQKKVTVREAEFQLESNVLGAEGICWDLEGYRMPGYEPTGSDIEKVVEWFADAPARRRDRSPVQRRSRGPPRDPRPGRDRPGRCQAARLPGAHRLDPLGTAGAAQRLFSL